MYCRQLSPRWRSTFILDSHEIQSASWRHKLIGTSSPCISSPCLPICNEVKIRWWNEDLYKAILWNGSKWYSSVALLPFVKIVLCHPFLGACSDESYLQEYITPDRTWSTMLKEVAGIHMLPRCCGTLWSWLIDVKLRMAGFRS